ncbi:MAG: hypothetical protein JO040_04560 [Gemmatimonadetes bacterium]|nr:hypothetical protein [Gemmatimonadota bacterium]
MHRFPLLSLACALALGTAACAPRHASLPAAPFVPRLEGGATYDVEVDNRTSCLATVSLRSVAGREVYVGSVAAHSREVLSVDAAQDAYLHAWARDGGGESCDYQPAAPTNPVQVRVLHATRR